MFYVEYSDSLLQAEAVAPKEIGFVDAGGLKSLHGCAEQIKKGRKVVTDKYYDGDD